MSAMGPTGKNFPAARALASAFLLLALLLPWRGAFAAPAAAARRPIETCGMVIAAAEQAFGIPRQLLAAIARAESGRWIAERQANFAWPWTVTAGGEGRYFESKQAAIAEVKRLRRDGVTNIDVGCLQINLLYHPRAFRSLESAFDPMENAIYAARLLKELYLSTLDWTDAVALYHSANPSTRYRYLDKVSRYWYDEHRRAILALIRARRRQLLSMQESGENLIQVP